MQIWQAVRLGNLISVHGTLVQLNMVGGTWMCGDWDTPSSLFSWKVIVGGMLKVQPLFKVNLVDDKGKHVVLRKHWAVGPPATS